MNGQQQPQAGQPPQKDERFQKLNSLVLSNDEFLIITDGDNFDSVAAACGVALVLRSINKKAVLFSPVPLKLEGKPTLRGTEEFIFNLPDDERKMVILINCPVDQVEKVSSSDEGERLALNIEFRQGAPAIDSSKIEIAKSKSAFSAGFFVGCELKNEGELTKRGDWVVFNRAGVPKVWAKVNITDKQATISESVVSFLSNSGFKIPVEAAQNLFFGIKFGTNDFQNADSIALETAAFCLRIKEQFEKMAKMAAAQGAVGMPSPQPFGAALPQTGMPAVMPSTPAPVLNQAPIEQTEKKEGSRIDNLQNPPIFTGATTPKV